MALPDLTGQNIQDTYQRILQVSSSGEITDGTGSLFTPPTASHAITASYAISASVEITQEITSSYAQTSSYANYIYGTPDLSVSQITASGNISASGTIEGSNLSGTNTGDQDLSTLALKTAVSGAFTAASSSFSTRVTANDAKVSYTDAAVTTVINTAGVLSSSAQVTLEKINGGTF
tara:strand:- start:1493 stop:2023 length:531 start_codon:yes stop_codon:yes gene_type:complete